MSVNENFNPRRLERYLSAVWGSRAKPLILLTKTDLTDRLEDYLNETHKVAPGVDIVGLTNQHNGFHAFENKLEPGRTYAFVGSSGVGKTTLVNHLCDHLTLATQSVDGTIAVGIRPRRGIFIRHPREP
ncbi:MAG: GTPase RsgA [Bacillus subtilis]|nr:GTPase RsgA [Bacillus subtilis]